jgi:hypothetical protein
MTTTNNTVAQKNVTNVRLFVLFVLLVLSSNGVFGQTKEVTVTPTATTEVSVVKENAIEVKATTSIASMDFAVWFVGTQKSTNGTSSKATSFSKKALINSGINTNSVLIRTILKKVSTQESSVA